MLSKNDRALVAFLISEEAGTEDDTYPGRTSADKNLPNTVCYSENGTINLNTGGYKDIDVTIMARYSVTAKVDLTSGRTATVFDAFFTVEGPEWDSKLLAAAITTAARAKAAADAALDTPGPDVDLAEYTCLDVRHKTVENGFTEEKDAWIETLRLQMDCCPSNVS